MPIDSTKPYDPDNLFARLLRGEIPSKPLFETEHSLVIHDIAPAAPVHLLVLSKGAYVCWDDFAARASDAEIADFTRACGRAAREVGADQQGWRLIANIGKRGGQEIPHLHAHILAGQPLGRMLPG